MEFLSPLELKRRNREFMLYNQNCLEKSWVDVSFLGKIRSDPNFLLKHFVETAPYLEALTSNQYKVVRTFTVRVFQYSLICSKFLQIDLIYLENAKHTLSYVLP